MTARQIFEAVMIEMNKVNAPSLLLDDFNYLFNKAIYLYINKWYNAYDMNLQTTDNLHVLTSTAILPVEKCRNKYLLTQAKDGTQKTLADILAEKGITYHNDNNVLSEASLYGATYEAILPSDYLHIIGCKCFYYLTRSIGCRNKGGIYDFTAKRLTGDAWGAITDNVYNQPKPWRPYYYIHNVNTSTTIPTNPISNSQDKVSLSGSITGYVNKTNGNTITSQEFENLTSDGKLNYVPTYEYSNNGLKLESQTGKDQRHTVTIGENNLIESVTGFSRSLLGNNVDDRVDDLVLREAGVRYGNTSEVRMEIRYGKDDSVYQLIAVHVDYIKTPQNIRLTQEQLDLTLDTSQMMEFPDYVCQEIINELVKLCMENASDPRLQTNLAVNLTIANPAQQLQQTQQ